MPLDRSSVIRGPAAITYNGQTFYSKGDVKVLLAPKKFSLAIADEEIERRLDDYEITVVFTPQAPWSAAIAAVLWPYQNPGIGQLLVDDTDLPLIVHGRDGRKLTLSCAAITKMPGLLLKSTDTIYKEMEFRALPANNTARDTPGCIFAETTETYSFPAIARAGFLTIPYTAAWGDSPWDAINTEDGIEIDFDLAVEEKKSDDVGVYALLLKSLTATAKFKPLGMSVADILAVGSPERARGASLFTGTDLIISGGAVGNPLVTLFSAGAEESQNLVWHTVNDRVDMVTMRTARPVTSGALSAIFDMDVVPEEEG